MEVLYRWAYVSQARFHEEQGEEAVSEILGVSRIRNASLGVTGALIFAGGRFAQLLEGRELDVLDLQNSILHDTRHSTVTTIDMNLNPRRLFGDWALLYSGNSRFLKAS
ncbi:MAG: BLUF domain-containing protein [Alphaproteobacteria bacterium]|nr:BLUF domain-containing protein [Alphaproteobacteria bacterium]